MDESINILESSAGVGNNDVAFVARQPIYTRAAGLFAYELLYPHNTIAPALLEKDEKTAAEAFLHTFFDVGLERLVGDSVAFINIPRAFILHDHCTALPKDRIVLEVSGDVGSDQAVVRSLAALKNSGYKLGLHDFDYSDELRPMMDLVDYVSLSFKRISREEALRQFTFLKQFNVKTIASRVDSHETFELAKTAGFHYFRGRCFTKPRVANPTRIPLNRLSTMQLVIKLQEPELGTTEIEKIVGFDLVISYKLLQYVNSAALSLSRNIESIGHAIRMVGTERIRAWASLLLLSKLDDKPGEVIITAFIRGKMAEGLALVMGARNPASYYMVGLFSVVDALLNLPMPDAIQLLPFSKQVREALLNHEGPIGSVLNCVLAYEGGNWSEARCGDVDPATIRQCYLDAISSSRKMPKAGK